MVNQGAQIWNSRVTNVRLEPVPAGRTPNIRVYADNGWPRTYTPSLGNGYWYMGREAVERRLLPAADRRPRVRSHPRAAGPPHRAVRRPDVGQQRADLLHEPEPERDRDRLGQPHLRDVGGGTGPGVRVLGF